VLKSILRFFGVESEPNEVAQSLFAIIGDGVFVKASEHRDEDGSGATAKVQLAHLDAGLALTAANFVVSDFL